MGRPTTCRMGNRDLLAPPYSVAAGIAMPRAELSSEYAAHLESGGLPWEFVGEELDNAPFVIPVNVHGATAQDVKTYVNDLLSDIQPFTSLTYAEDDGEARTGYVLSVDRPEVVYREKSALLTIRGVRAGDTRSTGVEYTAQTHAFPYGFTFPGSGESAVPGDPRLKSPVSVKAYAAQAVTALAVGIKHAPQTEYDPLDSAYAGQSDTDADGGACSSAHAADTTWEAIASAPSIAIGDNGGWSWLLARLKNTGSSVGDVVYKWASSVTGSGISDTGTIYGRPIAATHKTGDGWECANLGEIVVPGVPVPSVDAGSGYGPTGTITENLTAATTLTVAEAFNGDNSLGLRFFESMPLAANYQIDSYTFWIDTLPSGLVSYPSDMYTTAELYKLNSSGPDTLIVEGSWTPVAGENTVTFPETLIPSDGNYGVLISITSEVSVIPTGNIILVADDEDAYATGAAYAQTAYDDETGLSVYTEQTDYDLKFNLTGRVPLGFTGATSVLDYSAIGGSTYVDYVVRLPLEGGGIFWRTSATSAGEGLLIEHSSRRPRDRGVYKCSATGTGVGQISGIVQSGWLNFMAGVENVVVVDAEVAGAAPGNVTVSAIAYGRWAGFVGSGT